MTWMQRTTRHAAEVHGHLPSYRQVKTIIALCSAILDRKGKKLWLLSSVMAR